MNSRTNLYNIHVNSIKRQNTYKYDYVKVFGSATLTTPMSLIDYALDQS